MLSTLNNTQKGIFFALCGFVSFACADACAKWLGMRYDVLIVIFWIYYISLILGLLFSPFLGGFKKTIQTKKFHIHIGRGLSAFGIALFVVSALKGIPLAMLYTILFMAPFIISIVAIPIYKEKVSAKNWLIIALGFCGVLVAFRPGFSDLQIEVLYALGALFFIIVLSMLARPLDHEESVHSLSFYPSLIVVALLSTTVVPQLTLPAFHDMLFFILGGFCVTVGLSAIAYGFRIAPYSTVAPIHYIQMVIALTLGYFVFDDVPDIWMLGGAMIIIASGIMLALSKND